MIKPLSLRDADLVEQLWGLQHAAYRLEAKAVGLTETPPLPDTFDSIRTSSDLFIGALSEDGELLGAVAVRGDTDGMLEITRLMVHPDHLRQGIGTKLLKYILANHSDQQGFTVTASTLNAPAVALYSKFGFRPVKQVGSAAGVELTIFRLDLSR
ncbi:MAG: GNAT family N-acetyltransferase [Paenibacillaceae bacterium]|uniref:GNAT family N-acetyltransferase n=1 Tax=Paenibacillus mellifer TaxID=2937794 RepID=A0A9X2BRD1_9BACL|nr:GNAT family N-acetyltransferase [Paenibacillus mellifer]MBW4841632.1 GNAT family N-acetyltransferase [Paenibacillaceae bacterium]MCK8487205.1 GNAT family N-acetyltransferase [Paenibacillus mellifer]